MICSRAVFLCAIHIVHAVCECEEKMSELPEEIVADFKLQLV